MVDRYYLMDPMTVFGFGRHSQNLDRLMSATPATLFIGLVGSRDFDTVADAIEAAKSGTDAGVLDAGADAGEADEGDPGRAADPDAGDAGKLAGSCGCGTNADGLNLAWLLAILIVCWPKEQGTLVH